jgi:hypothetical protein
MQTKKSSATEVVTGTAAGLILAWVAGQYLIYPYYHVQVDALENLKLTAWFTVVSIIRGYVWRRWFNRFT